MDSLHKREIAKGKMAMRIISIENKDLMKQDAEVIINSIGEDVTFGGYIARAIIDKCGKKIEAEAAKAAKTAYGKLKVPVGEFVSTTAGKSKDHEYILHCVCPYWGDFPDKANAHLILKNLIKDIFEFSNSKGVYRIALPPMGSGNCGYPTEVTSRAFFDGIFEFLEEHDLVTSLKEITICIIESDKTKEFRKEWEARYKEKYPDGEHLEDDDSDSEEEDKDISDDSDHDDKKQSGLQKAQAVNSKALAKSSAVKVPNKQPKAADSDSSDESSDDDANKQMSLQKKPVAASVAKPLVKKPASKADDSSSSESEEEKGPQKKPSKKPSNKPSKVSSKPKKPLDSSDGSDSSDNEAPKPSKKPSKKPSVKPPVKKKIEDSSSDDSSDSDAPAPIKKPAAGLGKKPLNKGKGKGSDSSSDSGSD